MAQHAISPSSTEYMEKVIRGNKLHSASSCAALTPFHSDHCRWLFNQDVRIITFARGSSSNALYHDIMGERFHAIVLPASCNLSSLAERGAKERILLQVAQTYMQASQRPSRDTVMRALLDVVQQRIGEILLFDADGSFNVQKSSLPKGYNR